MKRAWRWSNKASKRSALDSILDKVVRELFPGRDRTKRRPSGAMRPRAKSRRQNFTLEAIEPRLLLSTDITYTAVGSADLTLKAVGGDVNLYDASSTLLGSKTISAGDTSVSIGNNLPGALSADTLHIDLTNFGDLNVGAGNTLNIIFTGGDQRAFQDNVSLEGAPAGTLGFGLNVLSDSKITASAHAGFTGDLTLDSEVSAGNDPLVNQGILANANSGITLTGANLSASGNVTLTAHSAVSVNADGSVGGNTDDPGLAGEITGKIKDAINDNLGDKIHLVSLVTSFSSAKIDVGGNSVLSATGGDLALNATVDGTLTASSVNNSLVKITVVVGDADPEILIHDASTNVSASGKIDANAKSDITINASATPGANSDATKDAAVAVTVFDSEATLSVTGGATVNATGSGATTLLAKSKLDATTLADGSAGQAGAGVAVAVVFGDTTASIAGSTVDGHGVTLGADSDRSMTTTATSSIGGSSESTGKDNASETTLVNNGAGTSEGSITVAGAVAVAVDTGTTSAFVNTGIIGAGSSAVAITATAKDVLDTTADGSFTGDTTSSTNGVGVAVAINVLDRSNLAYILGNTDITGGSLAIEVLTPDKSEITAQTTAGYGSPENVGVGGSVALNFVFNHNKAYLDSSSQVTLHGLSKPNVTIEAHSNIEVTTKAKPSDGNGDASKTGVGISVALGYEEDTTSAYIDDSATLSGANALTLSATATHAMDTEAVNGAEAKSTAVTPVIAISVSDNDVSAKLGSGNELDIGGAFKATSTLTDVVSTSAEGDTKSGKTAVGISIGLTFVNDTSLATTGRDLVTTGGAAAFLSNVISISETSAKASAAGGEDEDKNGSFES
jgi:hypothetical protein